jgi:1-deoxy-D-xylulose-5-phosphate reductoisomerase
MLPVEPSSIGVNTLSVCGHLSDELEVIGLAAGRNAPVLVDQVRRFRPRAVAVACHEAAQSLRSNVDAAHLYIGPDSALELVENVDADILVAAIVGAAGLPATLAAIRKGMDIALANKETLVAAGELVMPLVREHGVHLLPVDSEHSAIFQCLQGQGPSIKRIVLTASGGPFRTAPLHAIRNATVEQALNHPTWNMGPKITIDSATMMNKALEIIEAHWLFGLRADQIQVIIHPQSIAHSFVEFTDNSVLAQLGPPDMKTPIQYALTWPHRRPGISHPMDWTQLSRLDFEQPNHERFPALALAYRAIEAGGTAGAILNAANEQAVAAFLGRRISFGQITQLVAQAMDAIPSTHIDSLATVQSADRAARQFVNQHVPSEAASPA